MRIFAILLLLATRAYAELTQGFQLFRDGHNLLFAIP